ncbi:MAG: glycosyltransferase family 9 protein [Opitutales bacterium]|nr:glycosyltransferase family 9 protein [Opitutales bacterium]
MLSSLFGYGWRGEPPKVGPNGPRRLLIVRADRLGDLVISTSCIQPLLEAWPETEVAFAVAEPFADIIRRRERLKVWAIGNQPAAVWEERIRAFEPSAVVFLNPHPKLESIAETARIPIRIGTSRERGARLTYWRPYNWKKQGTQHEAAYNFGLLSALGLQAPGRWLPDDFSHCTYTGDLPDAFQLIHLSSFGNKPTVSPAYWADLAEALRARYGWLPVIVGSDKHDPAIGQFLQHLPKELHKMVPVLAGKTTPAELAGLCRRACCMLSRDSGPAHLAAATGCPTLTIFLSQRPLMSPQRWHPLGTYSSVYIEPITPLPFESAHNEARRINKRLCIDSAVQIVGDMINS